MFCVEIQCEWDGTCSDYDRVVDIHPTCSLVSDTKQFRDYRYSHTTSHLGFSVHYEHRFDDSFFLLVGFSWNSEERTMAITTVKALEGATKLKQVKNFIKEMIASFSSVEVYKSYPQIRTDHLYSCSCSRIDPLSSWPCPPTKSDIPQLYNVLLSWKECQL